jgi:hypothetical protein
MGVIGFGMTMNGHVNGGALDAIFSQIAMR